MYRGVDWQVGMRVWRARVVAGPTAIGWVKAIVVSRLKLGFVVVEQPLAFVASVGFMNGVGEAVVRPYSRHVTQCCGNWFMGGRN